MPLDRFQDIVKAEKNRIMDEKVLRRILADIDKMSLPINRKYRRVSDMYKRKDVE